MVKVVNKDSFYYMTVSNLQQFLFSNQSLHVLHIYLSLQLVGKSHLFILFYFVQGRSQKNWENFRTIVINKGGSGSPKLPKMCAFGLKNGFFRQKLTKRVLNVQRMGGLGVVAGSPPATRDLNRTERAHVWKLFFGRFLPRLSGKR